jgi:heme A synthase
VESRPLSRRERLVHVLGILFFAAVMMFGVLCMTDVITLHNASTGQVEHHTLTRVVFGAIYLVIGLGGAGAFAAALLTRRHAPIPAPRSGSETADAAMDHPWDAFH